MLTVIASSVEGIKGEAQICQKTRRTAPTPAAERVQAHESIRACEVITECKVTLKSEENRTGGQPLMNAPIELRKPGREIAGRETPGRETTGKTVDRLREVYRQKSEQWGRNFRRSVREYVQQRAMNVSLLRSRYVFSAAWVD